MAVTLDGQLVVAISSRALFDFEEENLVFEAGFAQDFGPDAPPGIKKDAAYMKLQLERLDIPAKPGVAFSLVKKLLAFNDAPESAGEAASPAVPRQRVEVVILSRNDPVSGMRVFRSAQHYGLKIERGTFNRGAPPWRYLKPLNANLFLSTHLSDVRAALEAGVPAAQVYPQSARASDAHPNEVRIAFDGDAVLFSDEAERVFQAEGLSAFKLHEHSKATQPLLAGLLQPLQRLQQRLERAGQQRLRRLVAFVLLKGAQALQLEDALGLVGKQHGIAVKRNAHFVRVRVAGAHRMRVNLCGRNAGGQGLAHVAQVRR